MLSSQKETGGVQDLETSRKGAHRETSHNPKLDLLQPQTAGRNSTHALFSLRIITWRIGKGTRGKEDRRKLKNSSGEKNGVEKKRSKLTRRQRETKKKRKRDELGVNWLKI